MECVLSQEQKQVQKLSLSMRQSLEILQMSAQDLSELIKKECQKNPTIELADMGNDPHFPSAGQQDRDKHKEFLENIADKISLSDHLLQQVPEWDDDRKDILMRLLAFLDERGFLSDVLCDIAKVMKVQLSLLDDVRMSMTMLHPYGIGARDLKECLIIQLSQRGERGESQDITLAKTIVMHYFDELKAGKIDWIRRKLGISSAKVIAIGKMIAGLNFSPLSGFGNEAAEVIIPDMRIHKSHATDEWEIEFNDEITPTIRFSHVYRKVVCEQGNKSVAVDLQYLLRQAKAGRKLCEAVARRKETLLKIAQVILDKQIEFFEYGPSMLRPLRMCDVAKILGMHVSSVSRASRNKYIATPHGVWELSKFFDSAGSCDVSRRALMEKIKEIINANAVCMTDAEIVEALREYGINIARRTVTKYRQRINIPNSRRRIKKHAT